MAQKKVGHVLLEAGLITQEQLDACEQSVLETGQTVVQCLVEKSVVSSEKIAQVLAKYAGLEYLDQLSEQMVDVTLLGRVPLRFLRENVVMPVMLNGVPVILTPDPFQFQPIDELNILLGGNIRPVVATAKLISDGINRYYPMGGAKQMIEELEEEKEFEESVDFEHIEDKDILGTEAEAPIIKLVNHILFQAVKRGASDIHVEPFEKEVNIRYRIDGVMSNIMSPPKRVQGALSSRIKIMAGLNIAEKRIPQDGRIEIRVADKSIDLRVSVLPVSFGERIVMRLLDKSRTFSGLEAIGLSERDYKVLTHGIASPNGIFYITGPTGSGKTTTLYSILIRLNTPEVNILTVEDPVEYQMAGAGQVQVREKIGLTFAAALRSFLRQDPDIIMVGETRDQETAQISVQSALTGHLVLSTLHTNSAPATITRLLDMGVEPYLIASSVIGACAQRLVRKLCDKCKEQYVPSKEVLASIGLTPQQAQGITFYKAVGCQDCNKTGFRGRLAVFEMMEMTNEIAKLTMERADTKRIQQQAQADGMTLLLEDGVRKIQQGLTTIDEVLSVAMVEQDGEKIVA
jgi:general secretion pathway protein E